MLTIPALTSAETMFCKDIMIDIVAVCEEIVDAILPYWSDPVVMCWSERLSDMINKLEELDFSCPVLYTRYGVEPNSKPMEIAFNTCVKFYNWANAIAYDAADRLKTLTHEGSYDFMLHHFEPLYDARGLKWHEEEAE